jgi:hypothetical protein
LQLVNLLATIPSIPFILIIDVLWTVFNCAKSLAGVLLFAFFSQLPVALFIIVFQILTSPIGLIAIALDIIVGNGFSSISSMSSYTGTSENDMKNSLIILKQVQESLMERKCQLELIQCQIKNVYIGMKSMIEK